jgi:hypothetical protein
MPKPLTDSELDAYGIHAQAQRDVPLAALVAELRARRAGDAGRPWAILIVQPQQAGIIPQLLAAGRAPVLVLAAEGSAVRNLQLSSGGVCFDTYDPAAPLGLRQLLQSHRIGLQ